MVDLWCRLSQSSFVSTVIQMAEKDEYDHQQKELEKVCNPIISKLYQGGMPEGGPGGMPGGMPGGFPGGAGGGSSSGPTIEEVD